MYNNYLSVMKIGLSPYIPSAVYSRQYTLGLQICILVLFQIYRIYLWCIIYIVHMYCYNCRWVTAVLLLPGEKLLKARMRINNQLNLHMKPSLRIKHGTTLVGGEWSHPCAITTNTPPPPPPFSL